MLEYGRFKYLTILVVVLLSAVYALPNVFPQDPSVQVTANRGATIDAALKQRVEADLKKAGIVPKDVADRMQYARQPMADAAHAVIVAQLGALNVEAALIGIDRDGAVLMTYSQTGLLRGYTTDTDEPIAAAYEGTMGTARRSTAQ